MKELLALPWVLTLSAIASHHLALALPAGPVGGTGTIATIAQPGSGSGSVLNVTKSTGFPPGPCPPDEITFYTVPHSNPPVQIKFRDFDTSEDPPPWRAEPGRNETAVKILLEELVRDYSIPEDIHKRMTDHEYDWEEGPDPKVYVFMTPIELHEGFDLGLTEGNWADTVRGLQDFLTAYPGLALRFESYVLYEPGEEFYAARGHLRMETVETVARLDVT